MAQNKEKIVQAYIQAVKEISSAVVKADTLAQSYKDKFVALAPDLTDTSLTQGQIDAVASFVNDLHTLATSAVVTTVNSKDVPSHGVKALG